MHTRELAVVILAEEGAAGWQPEQVFTRQWIRFADGSEGWSYTLFDGTYCRRDERLHLYQSGGGPPYVEGPATRDGQPVAFKIWMAPGESVRRNTTPCPQEGPLAGRRPPGLSDDELLAMGYHRIDDDPGDIFEYASDEPTSWCTKCEDNIPRYEGACEHLITCWHCQANYTSEGDEEDRCPDCNSSQRECEDCSVDGAETCISCGRWICPECWPGHSDEGGIRECERGAPDWKEPA